MRCSADPAEELQRRALERHRRPAPDPLVEKDDQALLLGLGERVVQISGRHTVGGEDRREVGLKAALQNVQN